jgi:hypothetical protein
MKKSAAGMNNWLAVACVADGGSPTASESAPVRIGLGSHSRRSAGRRPKPMEGGGLPKTAVLASPGLAWQALAA